MLVTFSALIALKAITVWVELALFFFEYLLKPGMATLTLNPSETPVVTADSICYPPWLGQVPQVTCISVDELHRLFSTNPVQAAQTLQSYNTPLMVTSDQWRADKCRSKQDNQDYVCVNLWTSNQSKLVASCVFPKLIYSLNYNQKTIFVTGSFANYNANEGTTYLHDCQIVRSTSYQPGINR